MPECAAPLREGFSKKSQLSHSFSKLHKRHGGFSSSIRGEEHERTVGVNLSGWNPASIEKWVMSHTDFKGAFQLGIDEDARFPHEMDYGRMLFAFVR